MGGGGGGNSLTVSGAGASGQVTVTYGSGDRPDIPNLMVFLTDGNDSMGNSIAAIESASVAARGANGRIFAVGIDDITLTTLNAIASEPDPDHVFYASDFQALINLIQDIVDAVVQAGVAGTLYDIEVQSPDGATILVRALLTIDGQIIVISWHEV